MCGIYGYSGRGSRLLGTEFLNRAIASQKHRGPDGFGTQISASAGLGMVRLRIRAQECEAEPIRVHKNLYAAYNGEVYSDHLNGVPMGGKDEVVSLYKETPGRQVDGMYSLATLDTINDQIELRRDPYGIKPLYIRESGGLVTFSSELSVLIGRSNKVSLRREAISQFFAFGRPLDDKGFYNEIRSLTPGARAVVKKGKVNYKDVKSDFLLAEKPLISEPTDEEIRSTISNAVSDMLVSNRRIGVAVSGGLDSTILCAELNALGVEDLDLVSVRMQNSVDGIRNIKDLGLKKSCWKSWNLHQREYISGDYIDGLAQTVRVLGEPSRMSSIPLYLQLAEQAAAANITVLLIGEGADELFLGYNKYSQFMQNPSLNDFVFPREIGNLVATLFSVKEMQRLNSVLDSYTCNLPGLSDWEKLRASELALSLEPLLRRADHALMQGAVEGRTPFLHGGVPELARRIPVNALLKNDQTKVRLRRAYRNIISPNYATEIKRHFRAPISIWFQGPLLKQLKHKIMSRIELLSALGMRKTGVEDILSGTAAGSADMVDMSFKILSVIFWIEWLIEIDGLEDSDIVRAVSDCRF
ncbi:MAG: asparagine synthase [Gammaproteobacteria bacterium]|nr:asparagine synthase [Gammaproteobacteria bacterium]